MVLTSLTDLIHLCDVSEFVGLEKAGSKTIEGNLEQDYARDLLVVEPSLDIHTSHQTSAAVVPRIHLRDPTEPGERTLLVEAYTPVRGALRCDPRRSLMMPWDVVSEVGGGLQEAAVVGRFDAA